MASSVSPGPCQVVTPMLSWQSSAWPEAAAVWHGKEPPCLTGPAPAEDLARFREEFGEHPREKNYSPLLEKQRGWMILDTARPAGEI